MALRFMIESDLPVFMVALTPIAGFN